MKFKKFLPLLLVFPLSGCLFNKTLEIPTVDVESIKINLPALPSGRNSGAPRSSDGYDYIDLYELSDFHGAVNYEPDHSSGTYVGLSKLATYFEGKRALNPGGTVILSTGDMFQGSAESNLTRGYMVNYSMQYMGFDAMALGNHEFDWTDSWLKKNAELKYNTSTIPYLGANILKDGATPDFLRKSTIITRGDYKIGVIGVIGNELETTIMKSCLEGYEFVKYAPIVEAEAQILRNDMDCNAVVLLAHEAADKIEPLTSYCVDAVFGGHAHKDIPSSAAGATAPSLSTKNYGQSVAHITLKFDSATKEIVHGGATSEIEQMVNVASGLKEDANINNIMGQYAESIDKIKNIKLGRATEELSHEKALKNICTTKMHEAAVASASSLNIDSNKIIAAYHNINGGIRDDIAKGKITYGSVYKAFPFDNEIVLMKVSGRDFISYCKQLNNLAIYRTFESKASLNENEDYYIVLTDFLAFSEYFQDFKLNGEDIQDKDLIRTGKIVRDEVAQKIYDIRTVKNSKWDTNDMCYRYVS